MFPKGLTHNSGTKIQYLAIKKKNYVNVVLGQEQAFFYSKKGPFFRVLKISNFPERLTHNLSLINIR